MQSSPESSRVRPACMNEVCAHVCDGLGSEMRHACLIQGPYRPRENGGRGTTGSRASDWHAAGSQILLNCICYRAAYAGAHPTIAQDRIRNCMHPCQYLTAIPQTWTDGIPCKTTSLLAACTPGCQPANPPTPTHLVHDDLERLDGCDTHTVAFVRGQRQQVSHQLLAHWLQAQAQGSCREGACSGAGD